jgi:hypothetical protein
MQKYKNSFIPRLQVSYKSMKNAKKRIQGLKNILLYDNSNLVNLLK